MIPPSFIFALFTMGFFVIIGWAVVGALIGLFIASVPAIEGRMDMQYQGFDDAYHNFNDTKYNEYAEYISMVDSNAHARPDKRCYAYAKGYVEGKEALDKEQKKTELKQIEATLCIDC